MTDNRKSTITAKLAAQIVEYYRQAMKYLDSSHQAGMISGRQYKVGNNGLGTKNGSGNLFPRNLISILVGKCVLVFRPRQQNVLGVFLIQSY